VRQAKLYELEQLALQAESSKIVPTSKAIMENIEHKRLVHLFELLDGDGDGVISANRIDVEALEPQITKVIAPVLAKLADMAEAQLEQEEFVSVIKKYAKVKLSVRIDLEFAGTKNFVRSGGTHQKCLLG
jgi:hypothetical protein